MNVNRSRLIATVTLLSMALIIVMAMAPVSVSAQAQEAKTLILRLQYRNGTESKLLDLSNERVTIQFNDTVSFKNLVTNGEGSVVLNLPAGWKTDYVVYMKVWWNTSWGVSYLVNITGSSTNLKQLSHLNGTNVNCSIYNVRLKAVGSDEESLPYARIAIYDVNAGKIVRDETTTKEGLTGLLKLPATINENKDFENYEFRVTVYWTPTTPVAKIPVYNVTWTPNDIRSASIDTATNDFNKTKCSVYTITLEGQNIVTKNNVPLSSQGDLFIYAYVCSNGTLMSEQVRVDSRTTKFRVATVAFDDQPGAGRLSSYEFRVYWRWERASIEYIVYAKSNPFGTITEDVTHPGSLETETVAMAIGMLDKSENLLTLYDVAITFPIYGYTLSTSTGTSGAGTGLVDFSAIVGTSGEYYGPDWLPLPIKHGDTVLTYRIKANFEGIPVLDESFDLTGWNTWEIWENVPLLNFTCNVYWVSFRLLDASGKELVGPASLKVTYPDYGATLSFQIFNGSGGRRMSGGSGLTAVIGYKDVDGLAPLSPAKFDINDTSTSIALKFPVYNLVVYVYDWYGEAKLGGLNCTITFTKGLWNGLTQVGVENATAKSYTFEQLPAGGTYTINTYTKKGAQATPGFEAPNAQGKLIGKATVTMPSSDLTTSIKAPLYNPKFVIKAADGSSIPPELADLTYILVCANTSANPALLFNKSVEITYVSNQTKNICFVGGWNYPVRVYIGGVVVFNEPVRLPDPAVTEAVTLNVNLYKSAIKALTYDGRTPIPNLEVRYGWTGINVTKFDAGQLFSDDWSSYLNLFKGVDATHDGSVIAYNTSRTVTGADGTAYLWVPVWSINEAGLNFTTIVLGVYTVPEQTGGVPATAPKKLVIHRDYCKVGIEGMRANVTAVKPDIGNLKTYAYNFYVKVLDYLDRPLANYVVFVNGSYVAGEFEDVIATQRTNSSGVASFVSGVGGVFFFANYSYIANAFEDVTVDYPQVASSSLEANNWAQGSVITAKFPGALIIKALDWSGSPLVGATVKLFWASGSWASGLTALARTDANGMVTINMVDTTKIYTVEVWFRGSVINQKYRLEEQLVFPDGVNVFSYTERMLVFSPKFTLISDTGVALPTGITVNVSWPDGAVETYTTDATGSVMLKQAPIGKYRVEAVWENVVIYISDLWISSDAPVTLKTTVFEVGLRILTPKGTPLAGAEVSIVYPNGKEVTVVLDSQGKVVLPFVAVDEVRNVLTVKSVTWKNAVISLTGNKATIRASDTVSFYTANVYTLTVSVVGAQGQPLSGATVTVLKDGKVVTTARAEGGVAVIELPAGAYKVEATYLGKKAEASVTVSADTTATVTLDVYMTIGGQAFSVGEIVLWIVVAIIIVIVLAAIIIALTRITRRKAPATATGT
ncbi:MAG: carboxypeptidase-like regulatory domain-containing protein [Candidatus Nezhaarchaeales archaeon]